MQQKLGTEHRLGHHQSIFSPILNLFSNYKGTNMRSSREILIGFLTNQEMRQTEQRTKLLVKCFIRLLDGLDEEHNTKEWREMRSELNRVRIYYRSQYRMDKLVPGSAGTTFTEMELDDIEEAGKINGQITKRLSAIKKANKGGA